MEDSDRDMETAIQTISMCRLYAPMYRQFGFIHYAEFLLANARRAERWLVKAGEAYPRQCDSSGKPVP